MVFEQPTRLILLIRFIDLFGWSRLFSPAPLDDRRRSLTFVCFWIHVEQDGCRTIGLINGYDWQTANGGVIEFKSYCSASASRFVDWPISNTKGKLFGFEDWALLDDYDSWESKELCERVIKKGSTILIASATFPINRSLISNNFELFAKWHSTISRSTWKHVFVPKYSNLKVIQEIANSYRNVFQGFSHWQILGEQSI